VVVVLGTSMQCHPFLWKSLNFDGVLYYGNFSKNRKDGKDGYIHDILKYVPGFFGSAQLVVLL
jgi:hypothetical protein